MTALLNKATQMVKTLDFDSLAKIADSIDDITNPVLDMVLNRMQEIDETKFIAYCENY